MKQHTMISGYEYDALMSSLRVSVSKHLLDVFYTLIWANDYYYDLIGYTKEEYEEKFENNPQKYYASHGLLSELGKIAAVVSRAVSEGKGGYSLDTRMPVKGGGFLWIRMAGTFTDEYVDGKQVSYTVMSDIDDLVRIQTDQSITYNNIPGFVAKFLVSRGKRLKIVYANDQFREFFGSDGILDDANEMFRLNMEKNAEVLENLWEDIRQTKPLHFLTQLQNRRGQTLWMQVSGECVETLADGCVYLLIYIDVTDVTGLKEIQKKLEAALDAAEKANRAKTIFLSHMSHDIRTPINGVLGMTDIALRNIDDRERLVDCLKKIDSSSHHLLSLINDVLDMSRIESGKVVIEDKPFYVSVLLDGCYSVVAGQAIQKNIRIETDFSPIEADVLEGDEIRLRQILINILGNAVKFTPEGGQIFFSASTVSENEREASLTVCVRDTGVGMSPEYQERIFEPFSQETASGRSEYQGTGLGMAIVKQLLDIMGGKISLKSAPGKGSEFTVRFVLPFGNAEKLEKSKSSEEIDLSGLRVLIAEDNEMNMEIARYILESGFAEVTPVFDGKAALELFKEKPAGTFDVILMDVMMPVMDGLQATRAIRACGKPDAKKIPILAMTANAYAEDRQAALDAGMDRHLAKPVEREDLLRALSDVTKNSR